MESNDLNDYLKSDRYIDFDDRAIQQKANELFHRLSNEVDKIKTVYEFIRDEIHHSGDIGGERVTKTASEVLKYGEGVCIAKALLFAAILRYGGIPTGLCYQRLTSGGTPETGHVIHGLNAVYLFGQKRWIRLDARGNKQNVNAQFSIIEERLAWLVRTEYGEIDYPTIYSQTTLKTSKKRCIKA